MGCYVEVLNKRDWLFANCEKSYENNFPQWEEIDTKKYLPVVLVDNGTFYAAGIAYDRLEYSIFTNPSDLRPKECFIVSIKKLKKVSDLGKWIKNAKQKNTY